MMSTLRRVGLAALMIVAALLVISAAPANAGTVWTIKTAPNPDGGQPVPGGGTWITNKPKGYYIGRLREGWKFSVERTTPAGWSWGRALNGPKMCGYVMPGALNAKVAKRADTCSAKTRSEISRRLTIGRNFSSPAGTYKVIRSTATHCPLFYNYFDGTKFARGKPEQFVENVTGSVDYRYQTRDRQMYVVRDNKFRWGFMPRSCVTRGPGKLYNTND